MSTILVGSCGIWLPWTPQQQPGLSGIWPLHKEEPIALNPCTYVASSVTFHPAWATGQFKMHSILSKRSFMVGRRSDQPNLQVKPASEIFHSLGIKTSSTGQPLARSQDQFLKIPRSWEKAWEGAFPWPPTARLVTGGLSLRETAQGCHTEQKGKKAEKNLTHQYSSK